MEEKPTLTKIIVHEDRYDGLIIDENTISNFTDEFEIELTTLLNSIQNKKLLWIKIALDKSNFIPILTKYGFVFHHCNENDITLLKRLTTNPIVPTAKNHTLGVGVVVINEKNEILAIKDRLEKRFKLPGGYIDNDENISDAVVREVKEETGINVAFTSIIAIGHFKPHQFGESNVYIGCTAKALSKDIQIIDDYEIIEAKWIDLDDFLLSDEIYQFNKSIIKSALQDNGLFSSKIDMLKGRDIDYEVFL